MLALPLAAFFLFLEASVGGTIALFLVHLRGEVPRGFTLFTGWGFWICAALAFWLRISFPPGATPALDVPSDVWFGAERAFMIAYLTVYLVYLVALHSQAHGILSVLASVVPLLGLGSLWAAAHVTPGIQLGQLGAPLAELAGALALGSALTALSLGHWYLTSPSMSVAPLVRLTFLCLGALVVQIVLLAPLLLVPENGSTGFAVLLRDNGLFLAVRVIFGLAVPVVLAYMTWRTARIRSLDSATGLLYIMCALILTGEIAARTLFFMNGIAT